MDEVTVKTTYGNLHIYKKGDGKSVVLLLHGAGSDNAMLSWREVMDTLDGEAYTVYAPDLLGHGMSDSYDAIVGAHFYDIHIDAIKQLVDALNLTTFVLAGLSMGGAVAIGFALKYPAYVMRLIPVSSWGLSAQIPMHRFSYWYIHHTNLTLSQYRWLAKSKCLAKWSITASLIGHKGKISDALIDEVMKSCKGDRAGTSMQNFQRSSVTWDGVVPYYIERRLSELQMPVQYIAGEKDPLVPRTAIENAVEHTPNGKFILFEGSKHWSVKEMPERFGKIIEATDD